MSFDTYKDDDNKNEANNNSPYGSPAPQQPQSNPSPYGTPAGYAQGQGGNPDAPWGPAQPPASPYGAPPQSNPHAQQSPYSYPAPQNAHQQSQAAGGFNIFGLTWAKNVVPNPATGGMPPAAQKSNVLAYVLWFFLGAFGVHQFYLGNTNRGLFNLALMGVTFILGLTGIPFGLIYTAYWIYEAVTLNDQTNEVNSGYIRKSIL